MPFSGHREAWLSGNRTACTVMALIARRYAPAGGLRPGQRWVSSRWIRAGSNSGSTETVSTTAGAPRAPASPLSTASRAWPPGCSRSARGSASLAISRSSTVRVVDDAAAVSRSALDALGERLQPMLESPGASHLGLPVVTTPVPVGLSVPEPAGDAVALAGALPLSAEEARYVAATRSAHTLRGYRSYWAEWERWATQEAPAAPARGSGGDQSPLHVPRGRTAAGAASRSARCYGRRCARSGRRSRQSPRRRSAAAAPTGQFTDGNRANATNTPLDTNRPRMQTHPGWSDRSVREAHRWALTPRRFGFSFRAAK